MINSMVQSCEAIEKNYFGNEKRLYAICFTFLFLCVIWSMYSYIVEFTSTQGDGLFFQRSGSVMVFFGVLIEYSLKNITLPKIEIKSADEEDICLTHHNKPQKYLLLKFLAYFSILFGAIISGYGDLFLIYLK